MLWTAKKRSEKAGLPPGTLIHIGEKKVEEVTITVIDYDETHCLEKEVKAVEDLFPLRDSPSVTWVNVEGIHEVELLAKIGECFKLHPLTVEDILNTHQRPKMEDFGEYLFIVLKMLHQPDREGETVAEQVSLIVGSNFVLSFQEGMTGDVFNPIRERIRNAKGRITKNASDYLAHALIDAIVDNYFVVLEKLSEDIELLEEQLVEEPGPVTLNSIQNLKREMIYLRKAVWPLREVIGGLQRAESPLIQPSTGIYLRDVYDHTIQVIDTIETYRDILSGMLDIYLSSISNRLNAVMKVLTIITTIFMPLSFAAGVYGMNFRYMPGLESRWGFPLLLIFMVTTGISMLIYFRKMKWL
ncbi:MAG: magnesium/cobalt transporter CorA [Acidobacteriia bacterium]|nr:magnesium/cobalt transporter CorA [Terriglobia bacterium]